ncbi:MAG TPA: glycosyltransferase family 9 protein [Prolixibacteraceae bacterium]|nr:glycosyltransferase family 9 protein [Prolixibacteraceae bacterium]
MKKILVFRLSAMGDVALTVPVIRHVIENNSDLHITLVTRPFFAPFFFGIPRLKLYFPKLEEKHKGLTGLYRLFTDLRKMGPYEEVIDLHAVLRTKIVSFFFRISGTPVFSIDKGRAEKNELIRTKKIVFLKHSTQRYADTFIKAGIASRIGKAPYIDYSTEAFQSARSYLLGKIPEKGYLKIGLSPFANTAPKIWGLENFKELITLINQNHKAVFFLFGGGEKEIKLLKQLEQHAGNIHLVAGKFTLSEEIAMIRMLDLMIAMDSSNMHLASLSGVRTISVWGGTHPAFGFSALGQPEEYQIQPPEGILTCRPCSVFGGKKCIYPTIRCMELIKASDLYNKLVLLDVLNPKQKNIE